MRVLAVATFFQQLFYAGLIFCSFSIKGKGKEKETKARPGRKGAQKEKRENKENIIRLTTGEVARPAGAKGAEKCKQGKPALM